MVPQIGKMMFTTCDFRRNVCWAAIIVCLQLTVNFRPSASQNMSFNFQGFNSTDRLILIGDSFHDKVSSNIFLNAAGYVLEGQTCGRLLYKDKIRLRDTSSTGNVNSVASFSTNFTFEITNTLASANGSYGDGFSFTFAVDNVTNLGTPGGTMCLVNGTNDNNKNGPNHMFAIEFDTFMNAGPQGYNDPSNNHVGVDVSTLTSKATYNLCGNNVTACSYFVNGGEFTAWVDYYSANETLEVRLSNGSTLQGISRPPEALIHVAKLNLGQVFLDYMYVGFIGSVGGKVEYHDIKSWSFTSSGMPPAPATPSTPPSTMSSSKTWSNQVSLIAGVLAGSGFLALMGLGVLLYTCVRLRQIYLWPVDGKKPLFWPREFTYRELCLATNNFCDENLLGRGAFGHVYKGTLVGTNIPVAVKRLTNTANQGEREFIAEVTAIGQIRHRNLVQLHGWCREQGKFMLVYEYMPNNSLDKWLFQSDDSNPSSLPWNIRHNIVLGLAAALAYMHEEWEKCILHRDVKANNVMLDAEFHAHLGDFGLARLIDHGNTPETTAVGGTIGYLAPELSSTGKSTTKTDVYAFGILALEVACGRRVFDQNLSETSVVLLDCVWRAYEAGAILSIVDQRLQSVYDTNEVIILVQVALWCCHPDPDARPSMRFVRQCLINEVPLPPLPASKPVIKYALSVNDELIDQSNSTRLLQVQSTSNSESSSGRVTTFSTPGCPTPSDFSSTKFSIKIF